MSDDRGPSRYGLDEEWVDGYAVYAAATGDPMGKPSTQRLWTMSPLDAEQACEAAALLSGAYRALFGLSRRPDPTNRYEPVDGTCKSCGYEVAGTIQDSETVCFHCWQWARARQ